MAELSGSWICKDGVEVQIEKGKFTVVCWRSPQNSEFGHITLLFCRERQRNVPKCKTQVQRIVLLIKTFCLVTFRCLCYRRRRRGGLKAPYFLSMGAFRFSKCSFWWHTNQTYSSLDAGEWILLQSKQHDLIISINLPFCWAQIQTMFCLPIQLIVPLRCILVRHLSSGKFLQSVENFTLRVS